MQSDEASNALCVAGAGQAERNLKGPPLRFAIRRGLAAPLCGRGGGASMNRDRSSADGTQQRRICQVRFWRAGRGCGGRGSL